MSFLSLCAGSPSSPCNCVRDTCQVKGIEGLRLVGIIIRYSIIIIIIDTVLIIIIVCASFCW